MPEWRFDPSRPVAESSGRFYNCTELASCHRLVHHFPPNQAPGKSAHVRRMHVG
jgi:hypothetical protein